ncbi:hypothetical protein SMAC4_12935 [Sordaria macrospora]|uniref:uncharacterized protein n=1 Tax=Sordaria macrospora TaxID=5147 RepID=UPI001DF8821B|nr:hypothetical protein B0T09DRAFT_168811 [Sordaria sp. MPI-SDFR-AT-0083]WPJ57234.1 hypothetical protein SMAC4_12935 [Sordaria macrospora]
MTVILSASNRTQVTPSKPQTQLNSNIKMSSATPQKNTTNDATAGLNDESRGYPKPIGPKPPPKPTREGGEAADSQSTEEKKE